MKTNDLLANLHDMKVGERISMDQFEFFKVPNGWILYNYVYDEQTKEILSVDGTFVPQYVALVTPEGKPHPRPPFSPGIVIPT